MKACSVTISILCLLLFFSCRKEQFTTDPASLLEVKADTLHFDTLFTSFGSTSQIFRIVNGNNKSILINSVRLAGGNTSSYKINVDGKPGPAVANIEVGAHDSVYVFVTVTIDPTAAALPFIVRDSIAVEYNSNLQWVQLEAFGQNANFLRDHEVQSNETWNNDLPYVILGSLVIDTTAVLTINPGTRIHLHADAPIIVNGSLKVNGERYDSTRVVFTGDRLDEPYVDFPASWPGIIFMDVSHDNLLNYAVIKNAYQGIICNAPAFSGTKLTLNETIVDNAYDIGIVAINTSITARNLLISNCGRNLMIIKGGNYDFRNCTFAAVSDVYIQHKFPVAFISNYILENNIPFSEDLDASFRNCIFWADDNGLVRDEVVVSKQGATAFNLLFSDVVWRVSTPSPLAVINNAINENPRFDSIDKQTRFYSFRLGDGSPAIDAGKDAGVGIDLDGNPRPVGLPDIGAYEKQ